MSDKTKTELVRENYLLMMENGRLRRENEVFYRALQKRSLIGTVKRFVTVFKIAWRSA
jgi:hypothetical protein